MKQLNRIKLEENIFIVVTRSIHTIITLILGVGTQQSRDGSTLNQHAYTCIHHRIQLAVCDMTMSG